MKLPLWVDHTLGVVTVASVLGFLVFGMVAAYSLDERAQHVGVIGAVVCMLIAVPLLLVDEFCR